MALAEDMVPPTTPTGLDPYPLTESRGYRVACGCV